MVLAMETKRCWIKSQSFARGTCKPQNPNSNVRCGIKNIYFWEII